MTRSTLIGLLALGGIAFYFAFQSSKSPQGPSGPSHPPLPKGEETSPCRARIVTLGRSGAEVVLAYAGEASQVWAEWPGGRYQAPTKDACTGTLCRMVLPRPGLPEVRVGLDACPGTDLP